MEGWREDFDRAAEKLKEARVGSLFPRTEELLGVRVRALTLRVGLSVILFLLLMPMFCFMLLEDFHVAFVTIQTVCHARKDLSLLTVKVHSFLSLM